MQSKKFNFQNVYYTENTTIPAGQDTTGIISCGGMQLRGLLLPDNFTISNIAFNISPDGVNTYSVKNIDGTPLLIGSVSLGFLPLLPYLFDASPYIQIITSVQASDVTIGLSFMPLYQGVHN